MRTFKKTGKSVLRPYSQLAAQKIMYPLEEGIILVYARQSDKMQYGNVSTEVQTKTMYEFACTLVRDPDRQVLLIDENLQPDGRIISVSGRKKAEERHGLSTLYEYVSSPLMKVKVVMSFAEDRLFRDDTALEYNNYILILKNVKVVTHIFSTGKIYNFDIKWDCQEFRRKCEQASDELDEKIILRLRAARELMAEQGRWSSLGSLAAGFKVYRSSDRSDPMRCKPIEEPVYAAVVRDLFARYYEHGDAFRLFREIDGKPIFPLREKGEGTPHLSIRKLAPCGTGYTLTYYGLISILTNPMYVGIWIDRRTGKIIYNNHQAIVPESHFWYAFNRLSSENIDSTPNLNRISGKLWRGFGGRGRSKFPKREKKALLIYAIGGPEEGMEVYPVINDGIKEYYQLQDYRNGRLAEIPLAVEVKELDNVYLAILKRHLLDSQALKQFREYEEKLKASEQQSKLGLRAQIDGLADQMRELEEKASVLKNPRLLEKLDKEYTKLEGRKQKLEALYNQGPELRKRKRKKRLDYYETLERLGPHLEKFERDEVQILVEATTERVEIAPLSSRFFWLRIYWRAWAGEEYLIQRHGQQRRAWEMWEEELLRKMYPEGSATELMRMLPSKTWEAITHKAGRLGIRRAVREMGKMKELRAQESSLDQEIRVQYGMREIEAYKIIRTYLKNDILSE